MPTKPVASAAEPAERTLHFVSLGCPKNRVDSEVMLGVAERDGWRHVDDPDAADVIVVNTCGFIEAAKRESIDTILEMARHKETGRCRTLVVSGCLSQRYPTELAAELPEVDHFLGSSDALALGTVLAGRAPRVQVGNPADWVMRADDPRVLTTRGASAWVKIAEGCSRKCSFCVIPSLRGVQRSRGPDDVVREVEALAARGVLEVNLVSQDTVSYGRDGAPGQHLADLVARVADVAGIRWVRLHYLYPERLDDRLVELLATHPRVVPYVDMPLQHAADAMLVRMRRGHGGDRLRATVERLRDRVPTLTFRTAFIVGHPGETDAEFDELLEFVRWARFDHVGVFRYSDEETCRSHGLPGKVPSDVAEERADALMELQQGIARERNRARIGQTVKVLVEGPSEEHEWVLQGRHAGQAPEVDGCVYLEETDALPGTMVSARVTSASDYDLVATALSDDDRDEPAPGAERRRDGRVGLRTLR